MIDPLPDAPDPAIDPPAVFSQKAVAYVLAQKAMVPQLNAAIATFNAALAGGAYMMPYTFSTTTSDADPGPGFLRLDNATQNLATTLRLDLTGADAVDYTGPIDSFDASTSIVKGTLRIVKQGDQTKYLLFNVTARATPSGYRNITVACIGSSSATPFANNDNVLLHFQRNGDKGDVGSFFTLHIREERTSGTNGVAPSIISTGVYRRPLTIKKTDTIPGSSGLVGSAFTLPAGTYKVTGAASVSVSGSGTVGVKIAIFCVTDGAYVVIGQQDTGTNSLLTSIGIFGEFTSVGATKTYELRQLHNVAVSSVNLSAASSTGQIEVYTDLFIEKTA